MERRANFFVWLIKLTFHNSLDLLSGGVTGVRDSKLTLRCVWYQCMASATDGKSLLPLMSKSFIQNSPLQELVYTWKGTPLPTPVMVTWQDGRPGRCLACVFLSCFLKLYTAIRSLVNSVRNRAIQLCHSLTAVFYPRLPPFSARTLTKNTPLIIGVEVWKRSPGVWRVALLIETSDGAW